MGLPSELCLFHPLIHELCINRQSLDFNIRFTFSDSELCHLGNAENASAEEIDIVTHIDFDEVMYIHCILFGTLNK